MAKIIFYEKPGCGGNARQKSLLRASGHDLVVRDLLSERWTPETLRPFFGARPVTAWFNAASPRVKSGEVNPAVLSEHEALAMMMEDPLLIRRPLMQVGRTREAGFEPDRVKDWIGLSETKAPVDETCTKELGRAARSSEV